LFHIALWRERDDACRLCHVEGLCDVVAASALMSRTNTSSNRRVLERHHIQHPNQLEQLMNIISSGIGFHGSCSLEWLLTVGNAPK
jgi:hypothetical protein